MINIILGFVVPLVILFWWLNSYFLKKQVAKLGAELETAQWDLEQAQRARDKLITGLNGARLERASYEFEYKKFLGAAEKIRDILVDELDLA